MNILEKHMNNIDVEQASALSFECARAIDAALNAHFFNGFLSNNTDATDALWAEDTPLGQYRAACFAFLTSDDDLSFAVKKSALRAEVNAHATTIMCYMLKIMQEHGARRDEDHSKTWVTSSDIQGVIKRANHAARKAQQMVVVLSTKDNRPTDPFADNTSYVNTTETPQSKNVHSVGCSGHQKKRGI